MTLIARTLPDRPAPDAPCPDAPRPDAPAGLPADLPDEARIDWRPVLAPGGAWSALVHAGSSPALAARHCAGFAYLSVPYHDGSQIRQAWRIERSVRIAMCASIEEARLAEAGITAICPAVNRAGIAHAAALIDDPPQPLDARFWAAWSQPILTAARLLVVPGIDGWDRCPTVWRELRFALRHNMPVHVYGR